MSNTQTPLIIGSQASSDVSGMGIGAVAGGPLPNPETPVASSGGGGGGGAVTAGNGLTGGGVPPTTLSAQAADASIIVGAGGIAASVKSVAGHTGTVVLAAADVGLGNVLNKAQVGLGDAAGGDLTGTYPNPTLAPGATGYKIFRDLDFTTLTPGNIVDGANANMGGSGLTFTGENTAGNVQLALVAGAGIRFQPNGGQYNNAGRTGQAVRIDVAQLVSGYNLARPLRLWVWFKALTLGGTNQDFVRCLIETMFAANNATNSAGYGLPTINAGVRGYIIQGHVNGVSIAGFEQPQATDDIVVVEYPTGIVGTEFRVFSAQSSGGGIWPAVTALHAIGNGPLYPAAGTCASKAGTTAATPNVVLAATYASGAGQAVMDAGRLRIDAAL